MRLRRGTDEAFVELFSSFFSSSSSNLCQKRIKVQQLGWVDALAAALLWKNKTRGGEGEGFERVIHCDLPKWSMCPKLKSQPRLCLNKPCWR